MDLPLLKPDRHGHTLVSFQGLHIFRRFVWAAHLAACGAPTSGGDAAAASAVHPKVASKINSYIEIFFFLISFMPKLIQKDPKVVLQKDPESYLWSLNLFLIICYYS